MSGTPLLLVDDDAGFRASYVELLDAEGFDVRAAESPAVARKMFREHAPRVVLLDLMLPPSQTAQEGIALLEEFLNAAPLTKVIVVSGSGEVKTALSLVRKGAYDYLQKPVDPDVLLAVAQRARSLVLLESHARTLEEESRSGARSDLGLVGEAPSFVAARSLAERVAPTDLPVLLRGESGTGKDVFARYIHAQSRRATAPFIAVNCGALAPELLESALFGHKKGAFTGAVSDSKGLFLEANGGTLFLDEIGDTSLPLQVKLLRTLESGDVMPVGASQAICVDVRVVSATHRPLEAMATQGTFREDLFWRLRGMEIVLPPLRDRAVDLPLLAEHFLSLAGKLVPGRALPVLSPSALRALEAHDFPGNLRELRHEMQRALVLAQGRREIFDTDFSDSVLASARKGASAAGQGSAASGGVPVGSASGAVSGAPAGPRRRLEDQIAELERREIRSALDEHQGNRSRAAEALGLSRQGLLNKMARYGIQ